MDNETALRPASGGHLLQFYRDELELKEGAGSYLVAGLEAGESCIVLAATDHARLLTQAIEAAGLDVIGLMTQGRLTVLDAHELLENIMIGESPDPDLFHAVIGELVRETSYTAKGVRAFGELVAILWERGSVNAAIELEALWNGLLASLEIGLYCAYPSAVTGEGREADVLHICHHHDEVIGYEPHANGSGLTAKAVFPLSKTSPGAARHFAVQKLSRWGLDWPVDDAASIVTELVTNAVVHARSHQVVTVEVRDGAVRVVVWDKSAAPPIKSESDALSEGGRGLLMVEALAESWGVDSDEGGKSIWAQIRRPMDEGWTVQ